MYACVGSLEGRVLAVETCDDGILIAVAVAVAGDNAGGQ